MNEKESDVERKAVTLPGWPKAVITSSENGVSTLLFLDSAGKQAQITMQGDGEPGTVVNLMARRRRPEPSAPTRDESKVISVHVERVFHLEAEGKTLGRFVAVESMAGWGIVRLQRLEDGTQVLVDPMLNPEEAERLIGTANETFEAVSIKWMKPKPEKEEPEQPVAEDEE